MNLIHQLIVFRWIHPVEPIVVVLALAVPPDHFLRRPVNRLVRYRARPQNVR